MTILTGVLAILGVMAVLWTWRLSTRAECGAALALAIFGCFLIAAGVSEKAGMGTGGAAVALFGLLLFGVSILSEMGGDSGD